MDPDEIQMDLEDLEEFYKEHKNEIWRYLNSLTRNPEEADDLMQSVFLRFVDVIDRKSIRKNKARSLLFTMAHNMYIDQYRRRRKERSILEQQGKEQPQQTTDAHGEPYGALLVTIMEALENPDLPERTRMIVEMRILGHLSVPEICDSLGISKTTVYSELEKSMRYLRKVLERAGFDPDGH